MEDNKYNGKSLFIGNKITEVSRATKRKSAEMTVAIPDNLAEGIIKSSFCAISKDLEVRALFLSWSELKSEGVKDEK